MSLIAESIIDDIQSRVDIAEVVGHYVPLRRAGRHFKGLCPFHKERTPSFMVNTDKQIFHCFGCGVGGNVFSFLMQHDRMTFPEAVKQLAEQTGVRLPQAGQDWTPSDQSNKALILLMDKACHFFEKQLQSPAGASASAYLKKRGVPETVAGTFRLGLAPPGWDGLLKAAQSTGVSLEQLEKLGLIIKGDSGFYDRFRSRLIFPIVDIRGRVVGFGGRSMDGKEPKYLNSPETMLYIKGRHLFGLLQAKEAIVAKKTAILVEGYFDVVVLSGGGIANVISPLGTALTQDQARLIKRYAERVILAFDPDAAGEQAALRGIDVLLEEGLQVHVAQLPQGVDPDEVLQQQGQKVLEQLLEQSPGIFEFLLQMAAKRYPANTTENRVKRAQFVLTTIVKVPDAMLRQEYVRLLAGKLQLDEQAVAQELAKIQSPRSRSAGLASEMPRAAAKGAEALFVAMVLDDPQRWLNLNNRQDVLAALTDPMLKEALLIMDELCAGGGAHSATTAQAVSRLMARGKADTAAYLTRLLQEMPAQEQAFEDCARRLKDMERQRLMHDKLVKLRSAQQAGRMNETKQLLSEYQELLVHAKGG